MLRIDQQLEQKRAVSAKVRRLLFIDIKKIRRWSGLLVLLLFIFYFFIYGQVPEAEGFVKGWYNNTTRDLREYLSATTVFPDTFCNETTYILIMVCSAPANIEARNAIRRSWGSETRIAGYRISIYFILGRTNNATVQNIVNEENTRHRDIVQESFIDSYFNLTLKTTSMLKMAATHCMHTAKFLMKIDDDMFLHTTFLIQTLATLNKSNNILLGHLICGAKPVKDINNKWYSPSYMYKGDTYPNYLSGTAYIMSIDVAPVLYKTAVETPLLHLEDVFITGICAQLSGIKPQHHSGFTYTAQVMDPCVLKNIITVHELSPSAILDLYKSTSSRDLEEECRLHREKHKTKTFFLNILNKMKLGDEKRNCY